MAVTVIRDELQQQDSGRGYDDSKDEILRCVEEVMYDTIVDADLVEFDLLVPQRTAMFDSFWNACWKQAHY